MTMEEMFLFFIAGGIVGYIIGRIVAAYKAEPDDKHHDLF